MKFIDRIVDYIWPPKPVDKNDTLPIAMRRDRSRLGVKPVGIFVRAQTDDDVFVACDIAHLDKISLRRWLQRHGDNRVAEDVCAILLGHGRFSGEQIV